MSEAPAYTTQTCGRHPSRPSERACAECGSPLCADCLVSIGGRELCGPCKFRFVRNLARDEEVFHRGAHRALTTALLSIVCMQIVLGPMALAQGIAELRRTCTERERRERWKAVAAVVISALTVTFVIVNYALMALGLFR